MKLQSSICAGIDECLTYGMFLKENIDIVNQTSISAGFGAFESVMMRVLKGAVLNYIPSTGSETFYAHKCMSTHGERRVLNYIPSTGSETCFCMFFLLSRSTMRSKLHPQYGGGN